MKTIDVKRLILTSFIILLPIVVGLMLWDNLPEQIATHFNFSGEADGYSSKVEAVLVLPLVMTGLHILAIILTYLDPKSSNVTGKMRKLVYWLVPLISLAVQGNIFAAAMGLPFNFKWIGVVMGLLFLVIGNYLPKTKQNYTVGIKLPWTLDNEENWYKTHRLAGKLWVAGGLLIGLTSFLPKLFPYVMGVSFLVMFLVPTIYSYWLGHRLKSEK